MKVYRKTSWTAGELLAAQFDNKYVAFTVEHYTIEATDGSHWGALLCDNNGHILTHDEIFVLIERLQTFYSLVLPETIEHANAQAIVENEQRYAHQKINRSPKQLAGWVYLLKSGPYYKIGVSAQVDERIKQLATLPPFDIELIHTIYSVDMYALEKDFHNLYANKRKNGEWFELSDSDVEYIKGFQNNE